jgi:hypothetical protein
MAGGKVNQAVVAQSIIAFIFLALTYLVSWWFIVPVGILLWMNQRELLGKKK